MSVVAAKVYENGTIRVAADSIIVSGWSKRTSNFGKLEQINGMIIGSVGTAYEASLMWQYMRTHKPDGGTEKDVLAFIVEFVRWKRELTGDATVVNDYLLAYKNKLFEVSGLFVHEIQDYVAIGAGCDFATAALYLGHSPEESVKAACTLSCVVSEPIVSCEM
jgi:hypothetical protein